MDANMAIPARDARIAAVTSQLEAEQARNAAAIHAHSPAVVAEPNVAVAVLSASRGANAAADVALPRDARQIVLWIDVPPGNGPYRLRIRDGSHTISEMDGLVRNSQGALAASLPSSLFQNGDYTAELTAAGRIIGVYPLHIQRR